MDLAITSPDTSSDQAIEGNIQWAASSIDNEPRSRFHTPPSQVLKSAPQSESPTTQAEVCVYAVFDGTNAKDMRRTLFKSS
jgi:hypothetical protein